MSPSFINILTRILVCVGALNWGLIGLFSFNLVTALFGESFMTKLVYAVVGASGVFQVARLSDSRSATKSTSPS